MRKKPDWENPESVVNMGDAELIEATNKAARDLSYYNAAEGPCWYNEGKQRRVAHSVFKELEKECNRRSLNWNEDNVGYLV